MGIDHEAYLLSQLEEHKTRHDRFRRDILTVLAAIIRSQGGTLRIPRVNISSVGTRETLTSSVDPDTGDMVFRLQTMPPEEVAR
ncbi:MAG: hypothetical protein JW990_00200 [Thermoleophilia bacterium]|nr:hypothetical protein [Thermoleophilia bacterium]